VKLRAKGVKEVRGRSRRDQVYRLILHSEFPAATATEARARSEKIKYRKKNNANDPSLPIGNESSRQFKK